MISEERMAQAAAQASEALQQYWNSCDMEIHEFSPRFQRKMRRLIGEVKHPHLHRALKSAACVLLVFLIGFASVLTFSVEARAAFVRWVKEIYEDSIVYRFYGDREESASLNYRVTWVPEGYELVDEYESDTIYSAIYQKGENIQEVFVIEWYLISEDRQIQYLLQDSEYDCIDISLNNAKGFFYPASIDGESNSLLWIDEKNGVTFNMNSLLDFDTMLKIAESIIYDPPQQTASIHDYHVTWVPEGYELVDEYVLDLIYSALYENSDGSNERDGFVIEWSCVEDGDNIALVTYGEEYQCEDIKVNGHRGNFYQSLSGNDSNVLIWVNEQEMIEYHINSYLPFEQMLKIAESIEKVN